LVVDVGGLLSSRKVLVAAAQLGPINEETQTVNIYLSRIHVEESPVLGAEGTVTLRDEAELLRHYGWPAYWNGFSNEEIYGEGNPWLPHPDELGLESEEGDPHLRSAKTLLGYTLEAVDGSAGRIDDFILDDDTWRVRSLVVRTRTWFSGRSVLVSPDWVASVRPEEGEVLVTHGCDEVRNGQELPEES